MARPRIDLRFTAPSAAALLVAALCATAAPVAVAQTFIPQGPSPSFGPTTIIQSGDAPPNGTVSGGVQAVITDPGDPDTMYLGGVNGGVWVTRNAGASWTPLSDNQRSLSIASLAFDPTDASRRTLIAGVGLTSNGFVGNGDVASRGGPRIGILYSNTGGASWSELGGATLAGKSIVGVAARGSTILAAAAEPHDAAAAGGLFISNDRGANFQPVTLGSGGGTAAVTSLAADPANQSNFYAAVNSTVVSDRGVYFSNNMGAGWTKGLDLAPGQIARLAAGPASSVVAGIYDGSGKLVALKLSKSGGAAGSWIDLAVPNTNPGGQASTNLAVAVDRDNPNIVYVAGDRTESGSTATAFRVTLQPGGGSVAETLTDQGTSNGSTTHADARAFAFDSSGRLIMVGDGGVYVRSNPQGNNGAWTGLNTSGLQPREGYTVAFDAISKRLVIAAQDTGTAFQDRPGSQSYTAIGQGDGVNAVVNDKTYSDHSALYTSAQNLGPLVRQTVNAQGRTVASTTFETTKDQPGVLNFEDDDFTERSDPDGPLNQLPFSSKIVLNKVDPTRIAFGTNYAYTTIDEGASSTNLELLNLGTAGTRIGPITALAYGTSDNINALLAGSGPASAGDPGRLFLSTTGAAGSLTPLTAYDGGTPSSVVFDQRTQARFFVADTATLKGSTDTGASFTDLTSNLAPLNIIRPTSLEFIANNGVNALLVGGLSNVVNGQSPVAAADSDGAGALSGWRAFGFGLPNAIVNQLVYNPSVDVLAVNLFGRGAWLLYDVTAYFPTATVLRFGLADNDSAPPESILTNGVYASRDLEKVGTGTLTIAGTTRYSGTTSVLGGQLAANGNLSSSSDLFVGPGGTLGGTGIVPTTVVAGTLGPGNSIGTITVNGNLTFNPGSIYQVEVAGTTADRTNVTGTATLAGTTQALFAPGALSRSYTILSAAGGLNGSFQNLTSAGLPGFLSPSLSYGATDVSLNLQSAMTATPGLAGNQLSVARALDTAFNAGPGLDAMPGLFGLSAGQLPAALELLSGDNASVGQSMAFTAGGQFAALLANRATTRRAEEQSAWLAGCAAPGATACDAESGPRNWSAWGTAFGGAQWLNADPVAGSNAAQQTIGGGAFGGDYRVGPQTLLGIAVGLSGSNYWVGATGANGRATGVHVGLYGQHDWRSLYVNAALAYSRFDGSAIRPIAGIGTTETAKSYAISSQLAGRVEVGRPFEVARFEGGALGLTPFAAVQPAVLWTPGIAESSVTATGAPGVFALNYQPQATGSLPTFLGVQLDATTELDSRPLTGWIRASWVHEFLTSRSVTAGFTVLPGSSFTVDGARAASDAARFDFGVKYAVGSQTSLFANGNVELSNRGQSLAGMVGLRVVW